MKSSRIKRVSDVLIGKQTSVRIPWVRELQAQHKSVQIKFWYTHCQEVMQTATAAVHENWKTCGYKTHRRNGIEIIRINLLKCVCNGFIPNAHGLGCGDPYHRCVWPPTLLKWRAEPSETIALASKGRSAALFVLLPVTVKEQHKLHG